VPRSPIWEKADQNASSKARSLAEQPPQAIPDDWRKFTSQAAIRGGRPRAYRATHPINAILNYAYSVLTVRTQIGLVVEGYDPTIGVLHDDKETRG
jgi:CRISPR/Cas system-associated endonuclease Cas1